MCYNTRMALKLLALSLAVTITAHPLVNEDVLEPSVRNEVDHALSIAPTNAPTSASIPFATNGLGTAQLAIRLISAQGSDGRWRSGTNDFTTAAVELLKSL